MTNPQSITLYTSELCPFAQRVRIALTEAKADFTSFEIDLKNKPEWYAPKVNPASKVPAIAYGGPKTDPANPSPDSIKLTESLILIEFVADLFPNSGLLPADPVQRAQIRFFIDTFATKFQGPWYSFQLAKEGYNVENVLKGVEALQDLLPDSSKGPYFAGATWTNADTAVAPWFLRLKTVVTNSAGKFKEEEAKTLWKTLESDEKYKKFWAYFNALTSRNSATGTYPEERILSHSLNSARN